VDGISVLKGDRVGRKLEPVVGNPVVMDGDVDTVS
jgi:hypothetical protein